MIRASVKVLSNRNIARSTFSLIFESNSELSQTKPGQFINIKIRGEEAPLFRRPFSIASVRDNSLEIIYVIIGKGTFYLSNLDTGDYMDIIGPLGNSFKFDTEKSNYLLVGGGVGVPPLLLLADVMNKYEIRPNLLTGFKNSAACFINKNNKSISVATDDGSRGFHGVVTDLLTEHLDKNKWDGIYACGPEPMLSVVSDIANKGDVPCSLAVERVFGCGTGICLGCIIDSSLKCYTETGKKYMLACKDGPVFDSTNINI